MSLRQPVRRHSQVSTPPGACRLDVANSIQDRFLASGIGGREGYPEGLQRPLDRMGGMRIVVKVTKNNKIKQSVVKYFS